MDPPKADVDIEAQNQAQINDIPETPIIVTNEDPPPAPNTVTANPQPQTNAHSHPQATGVNETPNWKTPAPKTTYNSEILQGISTSLFHKL